MDSALIWIIGTGFVMTLFALTGGLLLALPPHLFQNTIKPLIGLAAGALLGSALFHMLPHALGNGQRPMLLFLWMGLGFALFLGVDQFFEWRSPPEGQAIKSVGIMLLLADGLHNLIGGMMIGALFLESTAAGLAAWLAAVLHEVPQELGEFGAMVHSGYSNGQALLYNYFSALTFPLGGLLMWTLEMTIDVDVILAIGAGNFIYIATSGLLPAIKRASRFMAMISRFVAFLVGLILMFVIAVLESH